MGKTTMQSRWAGGMAFVSTVGTHEVRTDAPVAVGGDDSGASPKKLMMAALAGCTGVDVVSIVKKMRVNMTGLEITVEASLSNGEPALYEAMHLVYTFTGENLDPGKLQRAVELSQEKYCGVSMMYRQIMSITWEIRYGDELVAASSG